MNKVELVQVLAQLRLPLAAAGAVWRHGGGNGGGKLSFRQTRKESSGQRKTCGRHRPNGGGPDGDGGDGGDDGDDDPRRAGRRPTAPRRDAPIDQAMPASHRKSEGEEIRLPHLPETAAEVPQWLDSVAKALTACAINPETAFDWITRTEDDDVDFEELATTTPEFVSLHAKLRAALTKHASGDADRPKEVMRQI